MKDVEKEMLLLAGDHYEGMWAASAEKYKDPNSFLGAPKGIQLCQDLKFISITPDFKIDS